MHIYAFGSVCRGEMDTASDVDLLALVDGVDARFDPSTYSIYTYRRMQELWQSGSPFAWHLWCEARMLHGDEGEDWIRAQGAPMSYGAGVDDCRRFESIFASAAHALASGSRSRVFELSTVFLAMRNFATCYGLGFAGRREFSRRSPLRLGSASLGISEDEFGVFERARLLCTRGHGAELSISDFGMALTALGKIENWMRRLLEGSEPK